MKAHVSEKKKKEVKDLITLFNKYKVISLGDLTGLPSKQLQDIRNKLKKSLLIKTSKKRLIRLAIKDFKDKDLTGFRKYLDEIMPVLLFSNEDPFTLYRQLKKNKVNVGAKPGQIAPYNLEIKSGPTNFTPGPIIGELGQIGIVAAVESGKIVIKRDTIVAKEGEPIKPKVADILTKMGIEPMEVKLNLVVSYDDGVIYGKDVLDIDEEKLLHDIKLAYNSSFNLAVKVGYTCKETIKHLIKKASLEANGLDNKLDLKKHSLEKKVHEKIREEKKDIKEEIEKKSKPEEEKSKIEEKLGEKKEEKKEESKAKEKKVEEVKEEPKFEEKLVEEVKEEKSDEEVAKEVLLKMKDNDIKKKEELKQEEKKEKVPTTFELVEEKHKKAKKEDDKRIKAEDLINK
ncbi:MAG: 50S ribosomal protein L10 [Nanoarchaeota archaeon]|nr:50S ribosomal protein L10 [Nanoarchaeota archaeon]